MLLHALTEFAHNRRLLDDLAFAPKSIRWLIPLTVDGQLIGAGPLKLAKKTGVANIAAPEQHARKMLEAWLNFWLMD